MQKEYSLSEENVNDWNSASRNKLSLNQIYSNYDLEYIRQ